MKIVLTDCKTITKDDLDLTVFDKIGETVYYDLTPPEKLAERVADADAVICNKTVISAEIMKQAKNLKYIGLFATGYNNIDVEEAAKRGITVCNAGSYSTQAVAQHTFAFILNHYNNVAKYGNFVDDGGWKNSKTFSPFVFPMHELAGKTIGIVGYGSIGREVAKIANAFSMKVLAYARTPKKDDTVTFTDLDTLVKTSDIVTVHCPLNKDSQYMFDAEMFEKFKDGAYFVNTARGGVMVESALINAIKSGKLSGAAIDVLETEPMSQASELVNLPGLTVTPHVAWAPIETRERLLDIVTDNLKSFMEGTPKNKVN